jgi:hypothetical protein
MTTTPAPQLEMCPHCGPRGKPEFCYGMGEHWVLCIECKASSAMRPTVRAAAESWNTRAQATPPSPAPSVDVPSEQRVLMDIVGAYEANPTCFEALEVLRDYVTLRLNAHSPVNTAQPAGSAMLVQVVNEFLSDRLDGNFVDLDALEASIRNALTQPVNTGPTAEALWDDLKGCVDSDDRLFFDDKKAAAIIQRAIDAERLKAKEGWADELIAAHRRAALLSEIPPSPVIYVTKRPTIDGAGGDATILELRFKNGEKYTMPRDFEKDDAQQMELVDFLHDILNWRAKLDERLAALALGADKGGA